VIRALGTSVLFPGRVERAIAVSFVWAWWQHRPDGGQDSDGPVIASSS